MVLVLGVRGLGVNVDDSGSPAAVGLLAFALGFDADGRG